MRLRLHTLCAGILAVLLSANAQQTITINAGHVIAKASRANLMGINIAAYNSPKDFREAAAGPLSKIATGLIRMPGGSLSDKLYWNGNGVVRDDGTIDTSKYINHYWKVDYSAYKPGFTINNNDWSKASPMGSMDVKTMHIITRQLPVAHNMVTVNVGSGTPEMAAEWVRWANLKNGFGVKYWELGNELNGSWETGHIRPDGSTMTAEKYRELFVKFAKAMKAVDPSIKIGGPSCDVGHHADYFTPLLSEAGEYVDFITLHYYSLRSSLAPEDELFAGLKNLTPVMEKLTKLAKEYIPGRADKIEYSITEWNSKLPKDKDAYRLFNGLWFSAWVGEMMREGVDSATVWDMFSGADNGHGLLVENNGSYVPTGRYWAFWLWSNYMADSLVESIAASNSPLHIYATRNTDNLYLMVMNQSRTDTCPVQINLDGFHADSEGSEITLTARQYFWNPYAGKADWNYGPSIKPLNVTIPMQASIPPYSVKIFKFNRAGSAFKKTPSPIADIGDPELRVLLPKSEFCDLPVEGWVRVFKKGTDQPYAKDLPRVNLITSGPATTEQSFVIPAGGAGHFILKPNGVGKATVKASYGKLSAENIISFKPVNFEDHIAWNFESGKLEQPAISQHSYSVARLPNSKNYALKISFNNAEIKNSSNHMIDIKKYPAGVPKARIGGVVFDYMLPDGLQLAEGSSVQVVLQSTGAYWIPCGEVKLDAARGKWQTVHLEVPDKKFIQVMDRAFSIIFLITSSSPVNGDIYLDNIGFMLRPAKK